MDVEIKALEKEWLLRKKRKEYNETHREQIRISHKKYNEKNREKINAKKKEWYQKNYDEIQAKVKNYYITHPEAKKRKSELQLKWSRANKDRIHAYYVNYYNKKPDRFSMSVCGVRCKCGFEIKCAERNSKRKSIKCPNCRKSYHSADMEKITIRREGYKSVFDIRKEAQEKQEFEALVSNMLIRKGALSD